jgi:hypothetical protein
MSHLIQMSLEVYLQTLTGMYLILYIFRAVVMHILHLYIYIYLLYVFCFVIVYSLFCIVTFMYIIFPFVLLY